MFQITEIPVAERKSWSKCKWYVIEDGREYPMTFVTRGQAQKYIDQRNKVAAQEAAKAAELAAKHAKRIAHPIGAAVEPLRAATLERVGRDFDAYVARVAAKVEAVGGDLEKLAPSPNHRKDGQREFRAKQSAQAAYRALCGSTWVGNYNDRMEIVHIDDEKVARARQLDLDASSAAYSLFIDKLIGKVGGEVASATIEGSHVWGHSVLTVTKADGSVERWQTQQIMNRSVYGTLFNQWPTRKVK